MPLLSFNMTTAKRTGAAIVERALLGAATFLVTILLGRWGGPDELGLFIIFFPLLFIVIALQESLITAPYTVYSADHEDPAGRRAYLGSVLNHTVILSALAVLAFALAAIVLGMLGLAAYAGVAAMLAPVAPCVLLREFARRVVYAELKPHAAVAISGANSALQLALMGALHATGSLNAVTAFGAMGLSSLVVAAAWLIQHRRFIQFKGVPLAPAFWRNWSLGRWSVATQVGEIVRTQMFPWLLALAADERTVGIFAACAVIAALPTPLHVALSNILLPQFVQLQKQGGASAADRFMWQATGWLTAVMVAFFVVVAATSAWLVPAVYGPAYVGTQHALVVLTLAQVIAGASLPAARALFVMQRPDQVFASHLAGIVVNVALGIPMVHYWGITGAAYATLIGGALKALLGMAWYLVQVRREIGAQRATCVMPTMVGPALERAVSRRTKAVSLAAGAAWEETP
ncbi:MAG TPA: lipopolysaccharide biosynthesis protein [Lacipirellula sp.]